MWPLDIKAGFIRTLLLHLRTDFPELPEGECYTALCLYEHTSAPTPVSYIQWLKEAVKLYPLHMQRLRAG